MQQLMIPTDSLALVHRPEQVLGPKSESRANFSPKRLVILSGTSVICLETDIDHEFFSALGAA